MSGWADEGMQSGVLSAVEMGELLRGAHGHYVRLSNANEALKSKVTKLERECQSLTSQLANAQLELKASHLENEQLRAMLDKARATDPQQSQLQQSSSRPQSSHHRPTSSITSAALLEEDEEDGEEYEQDYDEEDEDEGGDVVQATTRTTHSGMGGGGGGVVRKNVLPTPGVGGGGSPARTAHAKSVWKPRGKFNTHQSQVHGIAVSDKDMVATASWDSWLKVHNVLPALMDGSNAGAEEVSSFLFPHGIYSVAFSAGREDLLGVACADKCGYLWMLGQKTVIPLKGHSHEVNCLAFHPTNVDAGVATVSDDRSACVWSVETGQCVVQLANVHDAEAYGCAFQPDGALLATVGFDNNGYLWDVRVKKKMAEAALRGHTDDVIGVSFDFTGNFIATGSDDATCKVWDLRRLQQPLISFEGHTGEVKRVNFNPCSKTMLVTASGDMTARIWDLQSAKCCSILTGHTDHVFDAAWSADGSYIVSASHDHSWRLWKSIDPDVAALGDVSYA